MTIVVNLRKNTYDVYIGRGSMWGNPFHMHGEASRDKVIAAYKEYLLRNEFLCDKIPELRGKTLGCFCKPKACHGDILAFYADNPDELEKARGFEKRK